MKLNTLIFLGVLLGAFLISTSIATDGEIEDKNQVASENDQVEHYGGGGGGWGGGGGGWGGGGRGGGWGRGGGGGGWGRGGGGGSWGGGGGGCHYGRCCHGGCSCCSTAQEAFAFMQSGTFRP